MDTRQLLSIISFLLQEEEDDENDNFLAILSIIRFRLRNGKQKSRTSLLFKCLTKKNQIRNLQRQQGRRERLILPGYPEMNASRKIFRLHTCVLSFGKVYDIADTFIFIELASNYWPCFIKNFINDGQPIKNNLLLGILAFKNISNAYII
uniref:Uncharacterized protein n=1 Tax=Daphnia galeata TaxID=27404 RepID=A0A8J2RNI8_9CRUS|nr:unnamed protein product [Daphnia galeata]